MNVKQKQFDELTAQGYNRIPVAREILADLDTPLSAYLKVADGSYSYLFESVQGGEKWGRYSIIGLPCRTILRVSANTITVDCDEHCIESGQSDDPLAWIATYIARFKVFDSPDLPRFTGGLVGYFGYDIIRNIESKLKHCGKPDVINTPDILLMLSEEVLVFDNLRGKLLIVVHADPKQQHAYVNAQKRLDDLTTQLRKNSIVQQEDITGNKKIEENDFISGFSQQDFEKAVAKIKAYIVDGDVMQVVLSQRMSIPYTASPLDLYRALRSLNPSPYMYYLNLGDFYIVGSSPEILTRVEDGVVTVRPIAGTRPRGDTEAADIAWEKELLNDPKERAEHLMLIDLGRNDVGRVATTGSVKLTEKMRIERYSHVMHIVSNVEGNLKDNLSAIDALAATFPAGTVSGAPKIRAMEIIDELEPVKRGIYSGAVGYLSWRGNMDTAIAIRTAVIKDATLHIQVGAGIVADSVPRYEWKETLNKGRAMFRAVAMVAAGLGANDAVDD